MENGITAVFNEKNEKIWKGELKNGNKWKGKGLFEWKDKNSNIWKCQG